MHRAACAIFAFHHNVIGLVGRHIRDVNRWLAIDIVICRIATPDVCQGAETVSGANVHAKNSVEGAARRVNHKRPGCRCHIGVPSRAAAILTANNRLTGFVRVALGAKNLRHDIPPAITPAIQLLLGLGWRNENRIGRIEKLVVGN